METQYKYELGDKLHEGRWTDVYRAKLQPNGEPVVVKLSHASQLELRELAKLRQEFEFAQSLGEDAAVRPLALQEGDGGTALVLEDFGGVSLKQLIGTGRLAVRSFLKIARVLASHLSTIHAAGIIHKDVKPQNILINPDTNIVKYCDFGISSKLNLKSQHLGNPEVLEGSLAYISPEQTGRMNRMVDYRSDLYSLGVTFYELLTGRLPFDASDSMELVHCHIARMPPPVHELNPKVPEILSKIVMRLLAKNAEERYQSAFGLKHDLEECLNRLDDNQIASFELGKKDFSGVFQISQKLYGRDEQTDTLLGAFERVSGGATEMMLVAGYSGVGKSALVNEVHKPITARRGNFIAGKYDQFQRNIPYSAIRQAFGEFANLLLTESGESLARWRERILESVGDLGQVLIDVVPTMERVIGKQPEVAQLSPQEAQIRLNNLFQSFVRAISRRDHPLVVFIDDLQWADSASLALIQTLMEDPDNTHFLFIGAYRDNEVDPSHPFVLMVDELKKGGVTVHDIVLPNLKKEHVHDLVSDALLTNDSTIDELTDLVFDKTQGNAFFTTELLKDLYDNDNLRFNLGTQTWEWDASHISGLNITDNVVELMTNKFVRLSEEAQEVARLASCIGAKFDLQILSIIHEVEEKKTLQDLWPAVQEGMLQPLNDNYKLIMNDEGAEKVRESSGSNGSATATIPKNEKRSTARTEFRFAHDRVQQAAYALIDEKDRQEIHLKIGRLILDHTSEKEIEDRVFDIVYQLNSGIQLITDPDEKVRTIQLNLQAAEKAMNSSAFAAALEYIEAALPLFKDDAWETQHDMIFKAHQMKAACQWSSYQMEEAWKTTEITLPKCDTEDERVLIYMLQTSLLFALNEHYKGTDVIREACRSLGIKLPKKANKVHIAIQYVLFRVALGFRKPEDILDIPEITDKHMINRCKILYNSVESAYMVEPDLMGLVSVIMARICLKHGNSEYSGFSYAMTALVIEGVLKQFNYAYQFSLLGQKLNEKYPHLDAKARIFFLGANFTYHWVNPVEGFIDWMKTAYQCAQESGNVHWGNYSVAFSRAQGFFFNRESLEEVVSDNSKYYEFHAKSKDREVTRNMYMLIDWANRLRGKPTEVENYYEYDREGHYKEMHEPGNFLMREYFFTTRMMEAYDEENEEESIYFAWKSFTIVLEVLGVMLDYQARFYYQLVFLKYKKKLKFWQRRKMGFAYAVNKLMMKLYVKSVPENYMAHHLLVQAEEARYKGKNRKAEKLYDEAIKEADKSKFPIIIALSNELAGNYFSEQEGKEKVANIYLNAAYKAYERWGAHAKSARLAKRYGLRTKEGASPDRTMTTGGTLTTTTGTGAMGGSGLDIQTVIKASQAISGEIKLESLLAKLMKIVIENAGAERACLFMEKDGNLFLEAEDSTTTSEPTVLKSIPLSEAKVSAAVVQFVDRTGQDVVLHDAAQEGKFTTDQYISGNNVKSLMCSPITNQGQILGLLYLENNLTTHAFTPARLEIMKMVSSQGGVSIKNAQLIAEETELQKIAKEMEMATEVQMSILPAQEDLDADQDYTIRAHMKPAEEVGGDYYDYYMQPDGSRWIAIGDVTGHGLNSGLMMLMAQTGFSSYLNSTKNPDPLELCNSLNKTLHTNMVERTEQKLYMTFTALKADGDGNFEHVGKHEDILVYRKATGKVERIETDGFWMGVVGDVSQMNKKATFKLNPGDFITLFTDGVIECRNKAGEQYEPERLIQTIEQYASQGLDKVRDEIVQSCLDFMDVMDDDITVFLMQKN